MTAQKLHALLRPFHNGDSDPVQAQAALDAAVAEWLLMKPEEEPKEEPDR